MKRIFAVALAVSLMTGSIAAQARDHDRHDDRHDRNGRHVERNRHDRHESHARYRDHGNHWQRQQVRDYRRDHARDYRPDYRRDYRREYRHEYRNAYADGYRHGRFDAGRYYHPVGYRAYSWHRGARLPAAYCSHRYVVNDYARYDLYSPPRGHHWVRVDHDVVLAAVATGAVVAVVNNLFY